MNTLKEQIDNLQEWGVGTSMLTLSKSGLDRNTKKVASLKKGFDHFIKK
jgi:hypothetical protein